MRLGGGWFDESRGRVVSFILPTAISNAFCEIFLSLMLKLRTQKRNRLFIGVVKAEQQTIVFSLTCSEFIKMLDGSGHKLIAADRSNDKSKSKVFYLIKS